MASSNRSSGPRRTRARPEGSPPAATHDLADRLHSSAIHLLRRLRREDDASGLPAPHLSALSVIVFAGPLTLGALADAEQVRPPTITRLVDKLEAAGLVDRVPDPVDRRISRVEATAKGVKLLHDGRRRRVASLAVSLRDLPANERSALAKAVPILERVVRAG
jgi:DNA-binding MarR family transcriptional regulator